MLIHAIVPEKGEITVKVPSDWARQDVEILVRKAQRKPAGKFARFYGVLNLPNIEQEIRTVREDWKDRL